jgi:hypothetical protein
LNHAIHHNKGNVFSVTRLSENKNGTTGNPLPVVPLLLQVYLQKRMKLTWTSIKISIAGAKLSHLVQKDRIWDHGSMAEQARIIFYLVYRAEANGNIESLKKHCTHFCFEKLKNKMERRDDRKNPAMISPIIKEIAITNVRPGKNKRPDLFTALLKGVIKDEHGGTEKFSEVWSFVRQGEWWVLDNIR